MNKIDMFKHMQSAKDTKLTNSQTALLGRINNVNDDKDEKLATRPQYFNTVADMKTADLKIGDMAITLGFYSANDGGGGKYIVKTTDTANGGSVHDLNTGLKATLIIENGRINVKQFGAHGDGIIEDTTYIQAALDFCKNKYTLYFDEGAYITNTLNLYKDNRYLISGCTLSNDGYYMSLPYNSAIILRGTSTNMFQCVDADATIPHIMITLSQLYFFSNKGIDSVFFKDLNLETSDINNCRIRNFGYILQGSMTQCTKIHKCQITNIQNCLITSSAAYPTTLSQMVDSEIFDNYLSGDVARNINMFDVINVASSKIYENYIDFCKHVFVRSNNSGEIAFINNTFDCCFRFIQKTMSNITLVGNRFTNFKSTTGLTIFTNPDSDMSGQPWGLFYCNNSGTRCYGFIDSVITNNFVLNCDNFLYGLTVEGVSGTVIIRDNVLLNITNNKYVWNAGWAASGVQTAIVYIDGLEEVVNVSLPSLLNSGNAKTYFYNNQKIRFNNMILINRDFKAWYTQDGDMAPIYGTTASRPKADKIGSKYFDTTLGYDIRTKTVGNYEVDTLTVAGGATAAGNITIKLNGVDKTIALALSDNTAALVAAKIRASTYGFIGWTVGGAGATVTFTKQLPGVCSAPTFTDTGSTGATASFAVTTAGTEDIWVNGAGTAV